MTLILFRLNGWRKGDDMLSWYWSLAGWDLALVTLLLFGTAVGMIVGSLVLVGKVIHWGFKPHDMETCQCQVCRRKMTPIHKARGEHLVWSEAKQDYVWQRKVPATTYVIGSNVDNSEWLTTTELREWDLVKMGGHFYVIKEVQTGADGYLVFVRPREMEKSKVVRVKDGVIKVKFEHAMLKWWKPISRGPE